MPDLSVQYQAPRPTSLGDLLNLASGVQQYQQAQQINPIALEKARLELLQAQQVNPLKLRQEEATTKLAEETLTPKIQKEKTSAEKAQFDFEKEKADKSREIISALTTSKAFQSGNRQEMLKEVGDTYNELLRSKFSPAEALLAVSALTNKIMQDPKGVIPYLENAVRQGVSAESRLGLQTPALTEQGGAPALFTRGTGTLTPATIGGQPTPQLTPQLTPQVPTQGVTPTQMGLPYPVRGAGDIRPLAPTELADKETGFKYRNSLVDANTKLSTSLRNLNEVIKQAEKIGKEEWMGGAGFLGTLGRNVSTFLGTEQGVNYKRLSKDLAQLQISLGADTSTDAGKQLVAAANGDITLPPDVLQEIARRTRGDRQNIEMQSQGAQIFAQKYGDANLKKFQKDWADNSKDSRVFEAISIYNSDMSDEDKKKEINRIFAGASPQYIEKIKQYRRNLTRLSETGGL